ncbi:probable disease resistance protein isoform X1 [Tanacetum coccineum]
MSTQDNYDVIFKLSGLEELIIEVDSEAGDWCDKLIEDVVEKVSTLPRLISFQFYLHDRVIDVIQVVDDTVKIYVPTENHLKLFLERRQDLETRLFQVYIGCFMSYAPEIPEFYRYDRYVKYYSGRGQNEVINRILTTVHAFELSNHNDIEHLSGNLIESMGHVQGCLIQSCNSMRAIVQGYQTQGRSLLPNLERLDAKNMPSLKRIWEGHMEKGSLSNLRTLVLCKCPLMTIVFCNVIVQQLQELKYLEVEDCYSVKEIVMCSQDISLNVFPKLSSLVLCKLPNLRKISSRLDWDSLEILKIHDCPKLKDLPFDSNSAMKLRSIEVDADLWEVLHWPDSHVKERLDRNNVHIATLFPGWYTGLTTRMNTRNPRKFSQALADESCESAMRARITASIQAAIERMDVKSEFLNMATSTEEESSTQASRRGAIDKTLFIKKDRRDIMLVQVYVDDIIFGSTKSSMVKDFEELMQKEFKMSSMGELTFFLGLQVKQSNAGDNHDRRINFRRMSISYLEEDGPWQCKKQTIVAISSTEANDVAAASCLCIRLQQFWATTASSQSINDVAITYAPRALQHKVLSISTYASVTRYLLSFQVTELATEPMNLMHSRSFKPTPSESSYGNLKNNLKLLKFWLLSLDPRCEHNPSPIQSQSQLNIQLKRERTGDVEGMEKQKTLKAKGMLQIAEEHTEPSKKPKLKTETIDALRN